MNNNDKNETAKFIILDDAIDDGKTILVRVSDIRHCIWEGSKCAYKLKFISNPDGFIYVKESPEVILNKINKIN